MLFVTIVLLVSNPKYTLGFFILITLPRWFAYYPIQLIKMDLIAVLFVYILNKIDYLSKYIIKGEKNEKDFN